MIYQLNDKYYVKISGYLIETIPSLKDGELDFKPTQNKIEITADVHYKNVSISAIKEKLKNKKSDEEKVDSKSKKMNDDTHKYKFNYIEK
jgi:hypothetical protein